MEELGKLHKVPLRQIWVHEAHAFTKWLSDEANLTLLAEELDLDVTFLQAEAAIGKFSVDILAEQTTSGKKIVIENQLEQTNHGHLGQLITYASGVDASFVVWIVASEREEHKRAIDWLNEHTDEEVSFFLVRVELWQIGDSPAAPKFVIVSQPNDWAKAAKHSTETGGAMTEVKLRQLDFWERFREFGLSQESSFNFRKAQPQHWYDMGTGSTKWYISLTLNSQSEQMACSVYMSKDKTQFKLFESKKTEIETKLGSPLEWMELPGKKASRIRLSVPCKLSNEKKWPEYFSWMLSTAHQFVSIFGDIDP